VSDRSRKGFRLGARWRATNGHLRFGFVTTILVFIAIFLLAVDLIPVDGNQEAARWRLFMDASPNEIGDTIAGIASTLAFLWIIVTVMMQGNELRLQRRELALTRKELKAQRNEFQKTAEALQSQTEIMLIEKDQRVSDIASRDSDGIVNLLLGEIRSGIMDHIFWRFDKISGGIPFASDTIEPFDSQELKGLNDRDYLEVVRQRLFEAEMNLAPFSNDTVLRHTPPKSHVVLRFFELLSDLLALSDKLSRAERSRMKLWGIPDIHRSLSALLDSDVWKQP
jgi:hypothetical protein